jgi:glycosyltransferase involved in cell wall biosynthesis
LPRIIFADNTGSYDGASLETKPLGGTEGSVIRLARELAKRGHQVTVFSNCTGAIEHEGVNWRPLSDKPPDRCDAYVAVQHPRLLSFIKHPRRRLIWVLWQPNNLKHYKQIWRMWLYRPVPILMSQHQVRIYSPFLPRRNPRILIPLGLPDEIRGWPPLAAPPGRRAIFASNPSRNLRRLVQIWAEQIHPRVPGATLDVYGVNGLKAGDKGWEQWEGGWLPAGLPAAVKASVVLHPPTTRANLNAALRQARVMLYLGHKSEAFCLSLAEAQALGVPAVISRTAVLPERVVDGVTGFHRDDDQGFATAAISLLTDDHLWREQHEAALRLQQGISWDEYAARFEAVLDDRLLPDSASPGE